MGSYAIRPLDTETWDAYARLMDKHNGAGFAYERPKGKSHCVMRKLVPAASS